MLRYEEQSLLLGEMMSELSSHILRCIYHGNSSDISLAALLGSNALLVIEYLVKRDSLGSHDQSEPLLDQLCSLSLSYAVI